MAKLHFPHFNFQTKVTIMYLNAAFARDFRLFWL